MFLFGVRMHLFTSVQVFVGFACANVLYIYAAPALIHRCLIFKSLLLCTRLEVFSGSRHVRSIASPFWHEVRES